MQDGMVPLIGMRKKVDFFDVNRNADSHRAGSLSDNSSQMRFATTQSQDGR
jgi:hypothetical protein